MAVTGSPSVEFESCLPPSKVVSDFSISLNTMVKDMKIKTKSGAGCVCVCCVCFVYKVMLLRDSAFFYFHIDDTFPSHGDGGAS